MSKYIKLIENIDLDEFKNNLKISRESKNITIEEAAKTLHVNVVILKNLENGELDKLANDVFTLGHIRTYLKWLGINSSVIIGDYKNVQNTKLKSKNLKINIPYRLKLSKFTASLISLILFILVVFVFKLIFFIFLSLLINEGFIPNHFK